MTSTAETLPEWFERVIGRPMQGNADSRRRSRATFVEQLLNRADLTPGELRKRLEQHAMCDNPGVHIEHIIETWQRWNEINPQTLDEEDKKLRLDFKVYLAACFLVTPADELDRITSGGDS